MYLQKRRILITLASEASYHRAQNVLENMNKEQYKSFHVLQQLHHHHCENWKVSFDLEKAKSEKKRKGTNSRKGDKKRHQKGLSHMFNIKDSSLIDLKPSSLSWDEFKNNCE
ncbi:13389_t:CDS:2 [Funneliformis mosseae]|uniref:13389_t:CDS:1 n=1 Tax=Funneliformis mosseae TaxID=27381 RepID=A0A9N9GKK4_FUNMO|nr:13389_t:CDS:2 [Funneliformis mosseae]